MKLRGTCKEALGTAILGIAATGGSMATATAGQISGTYVITYETRCALSPPRATPTPAYFTFSTADGTANGYVLTPSGTDTATASANVRYESKAGKSQMKINSTNFTITDSFGAYHNIGLYGTSPASVAVFGTYTASGTYVDGTNVIDTSTTSTSVGADGVSMITTENIKNRYRTDDGGATFYNIVGRGTIRLQHNAALTNGYRDEHCAGTLLGHRVSTAF